jgi:hypothetical protein
MTYALTNPVKDCLMEKAHHWPGVTSLGAITGKRPLVASRPKHFFRDKERPMPLWGGAFLGLGVLFHRDIAGVMRSLDRLGIWALAAGAVVVVAIAVNSLRRRRESRS